MNISSFIMLYSFGISTEASAPAVLSLLLRYECDSESYFCLHMYLYMYVC